MSRLPRRALALTATLSLLCLGPLLAQDLSRSEPLTLDEEYALFAREVPGFGGLFYDADGVPNVFLTDPAAASASPLSRVPRSTSSRATTATSS